MNGRNPGGARFKDAFFENAGGGIRTHELLQEWALNPSPLTWLGNPRIWVYRLLESFGNKSMAVDTGTAAPAGVNGSVHRGFMYDGF